MLWDVIGVIFMISPLAVAYLFYRNYQLEKKWRCLRYCWQMMSDFAGEALRDEDGSFDIFWEDVVNEHIAFMRNFGINTLSNKQLQIYEMALLERNIGILVEHRM